MNNLFNREVFLFILLFCHCFNTDAQIRKIKNYYSTGQIESSGKMYFYSNYDRRIPKEYEYFEGVVKKCGEWKYWFPNGKLARIENYILEKDILKRDSLPHGKWTWFNEDGINFREEVFSLGVLTEYDREIYHGTTLVGKAVLSNGELDTLIFNPLPETKNLVINGDFDYYFYKPIKVTYTGRSKIDEWIPFWTTLGRQTPDYISNLRKIDGIDNSRLISSPIPEEFNYVGLALYNRNQESYSEHIQGQLRHPLEKDKRYCVRISINASLYSGYRVNALGLHFSEIPFSTLKSNIHKPQLMFENLPNDAVAFEDICKTYVASGGEKIITIGGFVSLKPPVITPANNPIATRFGLNNAAYYLVNSIEVFEIENDSECSCKKNSIPEDSTISEQPVGSKIESGFKELEKGKSIVIENLIFAFDSYELQEGADSILMELLKYLSGNPEVNISIEGHTDDMGSQEYNQILSENRAKSVFKWLVSNGIDSNRLSYIGYGKQKPVIVPKTEAEKALNRRVEVLKLSLVPKKL